MKYQSRGVRYAVLAIAALFMIIAAHAARADSAAEIARRINNFRNGGYGILTAAVSGNTVLISGDDAITDSRMELELNIDEHVTVRWNIPYSGTIDDTSEHALISLTGSGVFEVADKGSIINTGAACCIYSAGETKISVNGGIVQAAGSGIAISARAIEVSGGIVCAGEGYALYIQDSGIAIVSGGFVFAYGTGITGTGNVVNNAKALNVKSAGVTCAWHKGIGGKIYMEGIAEDLVVFPADRANWCARGEQCGIEYADGIYPALFPIEDLSVIDRGEESVVTMFTFSHAKAIANVNMRKGPGVGYSIEGNLRRGELAEYLSVMITDETGTLWYNIKNPFTGAAAWISSDYSELVNIDED